MLKQFFKFYLSTLIQQNRLLTDTYLARLKAEYQNLSPDQRPTFKDIRASLEEMHRDMEVDEVQREQIVSFLIEHTNIMDTIMTIDN